MAILETTGQQFKRTAEVLDGAYDSGLSAIKIVGNGVQSASSIWSLPYDYVGVTYPTSTTEVYTTRVGGSGGSVQQVVTVTYTDSTKANLTSVERA